MKNFLTLPQLGIIFCLYILTNLSVLAHGNPPVYADIITTNITGTIWAEDDGNSLFNNEPTVSGVTVQLIEAASPFPVQTSVTVNGDYSFSGISPGKYRIIIPASQLANGGPLAGLNTCAGTNAADDMIDNDDNGENNLSGIITTEFTLDNDDPTNPVNITYIDFCFTSIDCASPNPLAVPSCSEIAPSDVICDLSILGSVCATMPLSSSGGIQPDPLCDGTSGADNISWMSFVAHRGLYDIIINPLECTFATTGKLGLEVGIYEDCTFSESVFCSAPCSTDPIVISSLTLTPGQTYYLYIDGCEGSTCSYSIDVVGNPLDPSLSVEDVCIRDNGTLACDSTTYCRSTAVGFVATGLDINATFSWDIEALTGGPYTGDSNPISTNNNLSLTFDNEGRYNVCLTGVANACFSNTDTTCVLINISDDVVVVDDEVFPDQIICFEDAGTFDVMTLEIFDPNGDGVFGWQGDAADIDLGNNQIIVPTPGCSYVQEFDLQQLPENETEDVFVTICGSELPTMIEGIMLTTANFVGTNTFTIDGIVSPTPDQNGCDRSINLTVESLDLGGTNMNPPICTFEGAILNFDYDPSASANIIFLDFEWRDPFGNFIIDDFNPNDPTDIAVVDIGIAGTYSLIVTINKNGQICTNTYPVDVDFDDFTISDPTVQGINQVCNTGNTTVTYTASSVDATLPYIWDFPSDVASATISGALSSLLTIDWAGSAGGAVSVQSENACGISNVVTTEVTILTAPTAGFSLPSQICLGDPITLSSTNNASVSQFNWNFGDADILAGGSGIGPHTLAWSTPGIKTITLQVTGFNSCTSETLSRSITVTAPISPPIINCSPSVNDVIFTWTQIPDVTYSVEVTSGQSGNFLNASSYQVTGLSAGEEVDIIVTAQATNSVCDDPVTTSSSCTAQDCPPTSITISAPQTTFCEDHPETVMLDAIVVTENTGSGSFAGSGIIDTQGTFDPAAAAIGTNTITYIYIADNGCNATETINLEVLPKPLADFDIINDEICITEDANLTYTGTNGVDEYDWDAGVGTIGNVPNPEVSFISPGVKTISLVVSKDGCTSDQVSKTIQVDALLPQIEIDCTPSEGSIAFSWNAIEGASSYLISINGTTQFSSINTSTTVSGLQSEEEVSLSVTAISDGACPDVNADIICQSTLVGIEEVSEKPILLYPNPAQSMLNIESDRKISGVIIRDLSGATMLTTQDRSIDIAHLAAGIYFVQLIENNNHMTMMKFVKL